MNKNILSLIILLNLSGLILNSQNIEVNSPDKNISVTVSNGEKLSYSVKYKSNPVLNQSQMGFEFKNEPAMTGNFTIVSHTIKDINETWIPVVKSKHARVLNNYNELHLILKEKTEKMRNMELFVRVYNESAAFPVQTFQG